MLFSEGMKAARKKKGYSQVDLAEKSGVPQSTISAVESGARKPTEETMKMIAHGLGCTVGELLGENKKPSAESGELREKVIDLLVGLQEKDVQRVVDFVAGLKAARKE